MPEIGLELARTHSQTTILFLLKKLENKGNVEEIIAQKHS